MKLIFVKCLFLFCFLEMLRNIRLLKRFVVDLKKNLQIIYFHGIRILLKDLYLSIRICFLRIEMVKK